MNFSINVLDTGSDGNCYLLSFGEEVLILDIGVCFSDLKKALNFDFSKVQGILLTHEHGDHSKCFKDILKVNKKIFCTNGTAEALKITRFGKVEYLKPQQVGSFKVTAFKVFHDAKEPCGFLVEFGGKRLVFVTDSCDLKTSFKNIDYWLFEANYSKEILHNSSLDISLKKRIETSHMSIDRCKLIFDAHNASKSDLVMLVHKSKNNGCTEEFLNKIPYACIAEKGLFIEFEI